MSKLYFTSSKFKSYIPDWILLLISLILFFKYFEILKPFNRQFYINDPKLLHPFATIERVTDNQLYIYSTIIPIIIIIIVSIYLRTQRKFKSFENINFEFLHFLQVSILGLLLSVTLVSIITDILKVWIGNPRPDFIARCGPKSGTPINTLVDVLDVCTAPIGEIYLLDGMKSTPSGHSSMSFAGLGFLSLWLLDVFNNLNFINNRDIVDFNNNNPNSNKKSSNFQLIFKIICILPLIFASYIALSRTQDYRHHFFDIIFGGLLGLILCYTIYKKYFGQNGNYTKDIQENSQSPLSSSSTGSEFFANV
ncbi:uncharacterized protein KGF55_001649 [Candida pseudojiufengensis]|uniref:uncharacterized protein n=1 Tax=Candida pseudojiufengensis TaxID=497109 RepID=UPI002224BF3E|nr:uncharacterized protein KGF55_001649 [Candida pseudojiufengensis]KAI5964580.1 hypothetical protein KGF55_001649 [Candida pseudojiufengensis]